MSLQMAEIKQKEQYVKENIKIIDEYKSQSSTINATQATRNEEQSNVAYQDLLTNYKNLLDQYNKLQENQTTATISSQNHISKLNQDIQTLQNKPQVSLEVRQYSEPRRKERETH